ncbi:hypothetical protein M8J76_005381 [Diaphorina citri]|nr:hypothetical protein M8J76_005381 [Diaphorina citri]
MSCRVKSALTTDAITSKTVLCRRIWFGICWRYCSSVWWPSFWCIPANTWLNVITNVEHCSRLADHRSPTVYHIAPFKSNNQVNEVIQVTEVEIHNCGS